MPFITITKQLLKPLHNNSSSNFYFNTNLSCHKLSEPERKRHGGYDESDERRVNEATERRRKHFVSANLMRQT